MRRTITPILLLLLALPLLSFAQTAPGADSRALLIGTWSGSASRPDGVTITTVFELKGDGRFVGAAKVNGQPFWEFAGRWELTGRQLTWTYLESSRPLPEAAKVDIDELVSVDRDQLVLVNRRTGLRHTFTRAKYN
jgi:hypothetical protein